MAMVLFFPRLRAESVCAVHARTGACPDLLDGFSVPAQRLGNHVTTGATIAGTYCVMVPFIVWATLRETSQLAASGRRVRMRIGLVSLSGGGEDELMHMSFGDTA